MIDKYGKCKMNIVEDPDQGGFVVPKRQLVEVHSDSIFHVHTKRCKHAGTDADEAYVKRAVELGAKAIVFTDHAPFPGNPFGNRMDYEDLPEYISSLKRLKEMYRDQISVQIGLEIEFFPSYLEYYKELQSNRDIEWFVLGQHMYEHSPGVYSFSDSEEELRETEYIGLIEAMVEGAKTGLFNVVAHPDRAFRRRKLWDEHMTEMSEKLINTVLENNLILEDNISSYRSENQHWDEFWQILDGILASDETKTAMVTKGIDAHSVKELDYYCGRFGSQSSL